MTASASGRYGVSSRSMRGVIAIFLILLVGVMSMPLGAAGARSGPLQPAKHALHGEMAIAVPDAQAAAEPRIGRRCATGSAAWSWSLIACQIDKRLPERAPISERRPPRAFYSVASDVRPANRDPHPDHGPPKPLS